MMMIDDTLYFDKELSLFIIISWFFFLDLTLRIKQSMKSVQCICGEGKGENMRR